MDLAVLASHVEQNAWLAAGLVPPPALTFSSHSPPPTIRTGPMTFHQLNIHGSAVGVLNTGERASLQDIDVSLAVVAKAGNKDVAEALKSLTQAVAVIESEEDLSPEDRAAVLDQLRELTAQAAQPEGARRAGLVKALLQSLGSSLQAAGGLAEVWETWGPTLQEFFGGG